MKQLRKVVDAIPSSVERIELYMPIQPYRNATKMDVFKALNSVNRSKIFFNRHDMTEQWETWQIAYTLRTIEQANQPNRLCSDVIKYGIFSYLEPSDIKNMFEALEPQQERSAPS